jgi:hypothetical protein
MAEYPLFLEVLQKIADIHLPKRFVSLKGNSNAPHFKWLAIIARLSGFTSPLFRRGAEKK